MQQMCSKTAPNPQFSWRGRGIITPCSDSKGNSAECRMIQVHGFFTCEAGMFALRFSIVLPNAPA